MPTIDASTRGGDLPNGAGAAAILAAGMGCAALGMLAFLGAASGGVKSLLNFHVPTGPLSGVTTLAIAIWLAAWFMLARRWGGRDIAMTRVNVAALVLVAVGFALTFPPTIDLLRGK